MIFHFLIRGTFLIILGACIIIFGALVAIIGASDLILGSLSKVLSTFHTIPGVRAITLTATPLYSCVCYYIRLSRCSFLYIRWLAFHAQCFFRSQFTPDSVQFGIWLGANILLLGANNLLLDEVYIEKSSSNGLDK